MREIEVEDANKSRASDIEVADLEDRNQKIKKKVLNIKINKVIKNITSVKIII